MVDIFNVQLFNDANGIKSWMNNCRDLEIDIKNSTQIRGAQKVDHR